MGNRKTRPMQAEAHVHSAADLDDSCDLAAPPNSADADADCDADCDADADVGCSSTRYKAVNLDENGKFIQFGYLQVAASEIVFHRVLNEHALALGVKKRPGKLLLSEPAQTSNQAEQPAHVPPIRWPFHLLRRYGYDQDLFTIETGRRACTGAGIYAFYTSNAAELFSNLQLAIQQSVNARKRQPTRTSQRGDASAGNTLQCNTDFMHWSPSLAAHTHGLFRHAAAGNTGDSSMFAQPPCHLVTSSAASAAAANNEAPYLVPSKASKHNYVNMLEKQQTEEESGPASSKPESQGVTAGEQTPEAARSRAATGEQRKYENLPQLEPSDALYVNVARDANGHLPGCPCHRKPALNYVELDRSCLRPAECADAAADEDAATWLSEATRFTVLTGGGGGGTGSSSPSGTSSVFSATSKLAQASGSFLGLSESRQPLLSSGSVGSASGLCATLALAKNGSQSRPNSDSLAQAHLCAMHKHAIKCKEHPLVKHSGSHKTIQCTQYTQIDFERTTALSNSKKTLELEAPRSSVTKELPGKKLSMDSCQLGLLRRDKSLTCDEHLLLWQQKQLTRFGSSPPKAAGMLAAEKFKRSRHNSNN